MKNHKVFGGNNKLESQIGSQIPLDLLLKAGHLCQQCNKIFLIGGECGCSAKKKVNGGDGGDTLLPIPLKNLLLGGETEEKTDFQLNDLEAGLTKFLDLSGLTSKQIKKFREAAEILKRSSNTPYLKASKVVQDVHALEERKQLKSKKNKLNEIEKNVNKNYFKDSSYEVKKSAAKAELLASELEKKDDLKEIKKGEPKLKKVTDNLLKNVLEAYDSNESDSESEFESVSSKSSSSKINLFDKDCKKILRKSPTLKNIVKNNAWTKFQKEISTDNFKNQIKAKQSPNENYNKVVAKVYNKLKNCDTDTESVKAKSSSTSPSFMHVRRSPRKKSSKSLSFTDSLSSKSSSISSINKTIESIEVRAKKLKRELNKLI